MGGFLIARLRSGNEQLPENIKINKKRSHFDFANILVKTNSHGFYLNLFSINQRLFKEMQQ